MRALAPCSLSAPLACNLPHLNLHLNPQRGHPQVPPSPGGSVHSCLLRLLRPHLNHHFPPAPGPALCVGWDVTSAHSSRGRQWKHHA